MLSPMAEQGSHYFDDDPTVESRPTVVEVWLPDMRLELVTDRGVFGYGGIDAGTKLLLSRRPDVPDGTTLLDLGCGAGAIALALGRRRPDATVWAVDVNSRARQLCADNALRNDVGNVRVVTPEEFPDDVAIDEIWSNPPIRIGKAALHELLVTWLGRLRPGGVAMLVVQKHLGSDSLQRWLTATGFPCDRLQSSGGYRVLRAVRPDASSSGRVDLDA
jgi:16S rRNA (guanine1207-N2)-methyltransferase